jgi:hypothetical protein
MRARTEALIGAGALAAVVALGSFLGVRRQPLGQEDARPSTFLAAPLGARGLAEGLTRLGVTVRRDRHGLQHLPSDSTGSGRVYVLLDPTAPLRGSEVARLKTWNDAREGNALLLAGPGAADLMRCYGYALDWRRLDSVEVRPPGPSGPMPWPRVGGVLAAVTDTMFADSSTVADAAVNRCFVPPILRVDTLLTTMTGRSVALRLTRADGGGEVTLVADAALFRNRSLRTTPAGPFALGLFAGRYPEVIFEETHHGFGEGGSLLAFTLEWSRRSPLGWAMWQLAIVGVMALLAGAVRFGPIRQVLVRQRRSPLEHVRALATALAAARGHDVAIGAMIEGLRRRLLPSGQRVRTDPRVWLDQLGTHVRTSRARRAVDALKQLTRPGQPPEGVLQAANAVEDVWEELRP